MKGHVRKRGNKWCFVVDVGKDENGKRIRKWFSGYDTKRAAEKALAAKLQEIHTGMYVEPARELFGDYMLSWLEDKRTQIRPNTYRSYRWLVQNHIVPALGRVELTNLRPQHLQKFYRQLQDGERPLSSRSIRFIHTLIHEALDRAVKWNLVPRNVADAVEPPRLEQKRGEVWTVEHVRTFLAANETAEPGCYVGFVLAIMTGMRKGEILALRWSDIDWEHGILRVNQTLAWVDGQPIFQEPKTERSRRAVALAPETIEALHRHRARQAQERLLFGQAYQDHDLVLARPDGRPMNPRTFDDAWYRALERANVPRIRFHDLRHTHASLMLAQGVHPKIVSERLGHATVNITLDTYSHLLPGLQSEVAHRFEELILRQNKAT